MFRVFKPEKLSIFWLLSLQNLFQRTCGPYLRECGLQKKGLSDGSVMHFSFYISV